ncbi:ornithine cyclodeaminase [Lipingzhangella halophila]|uniref:Ornithine cyclodeaminase n=1 Tax=Lipingzhangella halophila TaxID=1783352 RepID=A0A7W7RJG9_9ACTN|nr:ornithine cyclodeaminase family protein [Lipingzhangella halophila]MBB4933114.1 ornithine cyclodeaminase [Lipingzhangella halophila]
MTLCMGRSDLLRVLDVHACLDRLWDSFTAQIADSTQRRLRVGLPDPGGGAGAAAARLAGLLPGIPAYTVAVEAPVFQERAATRGVVCLHDLASGELLALLDSGTLGTWRTGLTAALGTHSLARFDAESLGIVGCDAQAALLVQGLTRLRPISGLIVADADRKRAADFADRCATEFGLAVRVAGDAAAVAAESDMVLTATGSGEPLLDRADARPGTHFTSIPGPGGADESGGRELPPELLRRSRVISDDAELAAAVGVLTHAGEASGTLRGVLTGETAAREGADDITVYLPAGLPRQDLALAWLAYRGASDADVGTDVDFLT